MAKRKEEEPIVEEAAIQETQTIDLAEAWSRGGVVDVVKSADSLPVINKETLSNLHTFPDTVQVQVLRKAYPNTKYFGKLKDKEEKSRAGDNHHSWRPGRVYPIFEIMYRANDDPRCILLDVSNAIQYLLADEFEFVPEL